MAQDPGHPLLPLTLTASGQFATVPQDSLREVRQCARAVLRTRVGHRIETPELGLTDPTFRAGVDLDEIDATLDEWEPRAGWELAMDPITGGVVGVRVTEVL